MGQRRRGEEEGGGEGEGRGRDGGERGRGKGGVGCMISCGPGRKLVSMKRCYTSHCGLSQPAQMNLNPTLLLSEDSPDGSVAGEVAVHPRALQQTISAVLQNNTHQHWR